MVTKKPILLVSYTFPPKAGIGGRRWAKFAKYLSRVGFEVHVLHAAAEGEVSFWNSDVIDNAAIKRISITSSYPGVLLRPSKTIIEKIMYRWYLFQLKTKTLGSPYDVGIGWNVEVTDRVRALLSGRGFDHIIITAAPFSTAYELVKLKAEFRDIQFIVDLRDPWTWGAGYGMRSIDSHRFKEEQRRERMVLNGADVILVPDATMKAFLDEKYPDRATAIHVLPHGFDPEDFGPKDLVSWSKYQKGIWYGTLYSGLESTLLTVSRALERSQTALDIFSGIQRYSEVFASWDPQQKYVVYRSPLPAKKLLSLLPHYKFVLILQPDYAKDFISTKIYEIIYSGVPILLIGKDGKLARFIEENHVGRWFNSEIDFMEPLSEWLKDTQELNKLKFNIDNYNFENLTRQLISILK